MFLRNEPDWNLVFFWQMYQDERKLCREGEFFQSGSFFGLAKLGDLRSSSVRGRVPKEVGVKDRRTNERMDLTSNVQRSTFNVQHEGELGMAGRAENTAVIDRRYKGNLRAGVATGTLLHRGGLHYPVMPRRVDTPHCA